MVNQIFISREEVVQDLLDSTIINQDSQEVNIPNFKVPFLPKDNKHINRLIRTPKRP